MDGHVDVSTVSQALFLLGPIYINSSSSIFGDFFVFELTVLSVIDLLVDALILL